MCNALSQAHAHKQSPDTGLLVRVVTKISLAFLSKTILSVLRYLAIIELNYKAQSHCQ